MSFVEFFNSLEVVNFSASELLFKGNNHSNRYSNAYEKNTDPPRDLWENIIPTIKVLDEFRELINYPIIINSVYRSPAYNRSVGGKPDSTHVQFRAIDFVVRGPSSPADWAATLKSMRTDGRFKGGIGVYNTFVHLDTRGRNADW